MSSDSLGTFIHRLSGVYRDPQRVLRDAQSLLSSEYGAHLRPTTEPLLNNDGSSTPPVLVLRGTIPMVYRNVTYNLPIDMYLPPPYPLRPPTVFIRPVPSMAIKENHRHVGLDGKVYLPYLHDWRPHSHELSVLAMMMSSLFGSEPPCYAKPANSAPPAYNGNTYNGNNGYGNGTTMNGGGGGHHRSEPPPPPYATSLPPNHSRTNSYGASTTTNSSSTTATTNNLSSQQSSSAHMERLQRQQEDLEKRMEAARLASIADEEKRQKEAEEAERKRRQAEHAQLLGDMRAMATSKVGYEIGEFFQRSKAELRLELKNQKQLEDGKSKLEGLVKEAEERRGELSKHAGDMDGAIDELATYVDAIKEQQQSTNSNESEQDDPLLKADKMAIPADVPSAQMLALSAENAAIDDCIYFLDRAFSQQRGSMSAEAFIKEVRKLSKRQFMAKAHLIKIAQSRARESNR
eukprot:CAMPEP_0183715730 /NCGR_PEP_ID=MMETSP0737-20130205/9849_1 /TAXON_ID=385413 /ORGANISM="Thalassiosira miniscula, Strain CCMP1093" /LENGTH=460 /DNA_ID=CAMNT_0025944865 /DNA_START=244 /DNA_END=1626 /DNA_ORIENTATION=+